MSTSVSAQLINQVTIDAPSSAAGTYLATGAAFGPEMTVGGISGSVVVVNDGSVTPTQGCGPLIGFPAGAIALIDRGGCPFVELVGNAQAAGAAAVIVVNNVAGNPITLGGVDNSITIPAGMVSQADGNTIKAGLPATGTASLRVFVADLSISKSATFDETHVMFTLVVANAGPDEAADVVVTDALPAAVEYVSDDCGGSIVPPWTWNIGTLANGAELTCIITTLALSEGLVSNTASVTTSADDPDSDNDTGQASVFVDFPDSRATFAVDKVFTDGNPAAVEVAIDCNTGLILDQVKSITPGNGVIFVVTEFDDEELNCEITESAPGGYSAEYDNGTVTNNESCVYEAVAFESEFTCTITNSPDPVEVIIEKEWVIEGSGLSGVDTSYYLTLYCNGDIVGSPGLEVPLGVSGCFSKFNLEAPASLATECLTFFGDSDAIFSALVIPNYPTSQCWVEETVYDSAIEIDNNCGDLEISAGNGASCVITNTVFFEGIPSLNRYGLMALILLISGFTLVSVRRFT